MINILVTGAAGNIGSALVEKLIIRKEYFVVGVDNMSTGRTWKLPAGNPSNFKFFKADVNRFEDLSTIMLTYSFDIVFHYAATVGVQRTLENPIMVLRDIDGIRNVLDISRNSNVKRIFYSSSSEVYGEPVEFPQHELTTPLNSRLPYAVVKNIGEAFLRSYNKEYGLPFTIFRFFNTYGPRQSEDFVISRFVMKALKNEELTVYGNGEQTRTFCYIDDNIETTLACLENDCCLNEVMNVGSDNEISVRELAKKVVSITKSASPIVYLPPLNEGDMSRRQPDISRMKKILNRELIPLDRGIAAVSEYFRSRLK